MTPLSMTPNSGFTLKGRSNKPTELATQLNMACLEVSLLFGVHCMALLIEAGNDNLLDVVELNFLDSV